MRKAASAIMLILCVTSVSVFAFNIQPAGADLCERCGNTVVKVIPETVELGPENVTGKELALSVFATSFVAGLIWAFAIKKVIQIKSEPLLLELPPYRKPLIQNVFAKSWIRMKDFVYIVIPLLALGGIAYGILDISGLTHIVVEPLSPITTWLGLPTVTIIPMIFGFLQKDLTGAMLLSVLGSEISFVLTPLQIYTFGVATTLGIPCMIALGMLIKEFGFKRAIILTITSIVYGLLFAGLAWRIIQLFE